MRFARGMTLLEVVIYIALLIALLPMFVGYLIQVGKEIGKFDAQNRLEQTSSLVFLEITKDITGATSVSTSTSTLGSNPSTLRFVNATGQTIVVDRPTVSVTMPSGTAQNVHRLRITVAGTAYWLTDSDLDVTRWYVATVRNSANTLTGLRIGFDMSMLNPGSDVYRNTRWSGDTTVSLQPQTIEN